MQIQTKAKEVLFVRYDVAYDFPVPINDLFTMSTKGRKLRLFKGTRYYNGGHQRRDNGFCRVYDKKRQLMEEMGRRIKGERTRMEIVYAPAKLPLDTIVQYPPKFSNLYLCAVISDLSLCKPKVAALVQGIQQGRTKPQDVSYYYRQQIQKQMQTQQIIDMDRIAAEQWEQAIILPCAVLVGKVNKVPIVQSC